MKHLKKKIFYLFTLILIGNTQAQQSFKESYTKYESSTILKNDYSPTYISKTKDGGLIAIFKETKGEYNSYYSIYKYNSERKLVKSETFETKTADKIYLGDDQIHFIRYEEKTKRKTEEQGYKGRNGFPNFYKSEFYIKSISIDDLNFRKDYKEWLSIDVENEIWSDNSLDNTIRFTADKENNNLLILSMVDFKTYKDENIEPTINIKASDDKKRKQNFNTSFYFNYIGKNLQTIFNQKIIVSNDYGEFRIIHKIIQNESIYMLLAVSDEKKTQIKSLDKKIHQDHYYMLKVDQNGHQFKSLENFEHDLTAVDFNLFKNQIFITGMYSTTFNNKIDGFCKAVLEKDTFNKIDTHYFEFSKDFLKDVKAPIDVTGSSTHKNSFQDQELSRKDVKYRILKNYRADQLYVDQNGACNIIIEQYKPIQSGGAPMMGGMPGMGGMMFTMSNTSYEERQIGIIGAKISADNKLIWSRRINNKDKKNNSLRTVYVNDTPYIIKKHTPKTHKLYNNADPKDKKKRYYYITSFDKNGGISSFRCSPYSKKSLSIIYKGFDEEIYIIDYRGEFLRIKRLNLKQ